MSAEKRRWCQGAYKRGVLRAVLAVGFAAVLGATGVSVAVAEPSVPSHAPAGASGRADDVGQSDDIEAIKQLKARYFRFMDTKDWGAMRGVFADDVVMDTTESGGVVIVGADPFIAFLRVTIGPVTTVHHGHTPEITVTSPTTAEGIWAMEDMLRWPANALDVHGYGHYHEVYEKVDGRWLIKKSKLTRLRMDVSEPGGVGEVPDAALDVVTGVVNKATEALDNGN